MFVISGCSTADGIQITIGCWAGRAANQHNADDCAKQEQPADRDGGNRGPDPWFDRSRRSLNAVDSGCDSIVHLHKDFFEVEIVDRNFGVPRLSHFAD